MESQSRKYRRHLIMIGGNEDCYVTELCSKKSRVGMTADRIKVKLAMSPSASSLSAHERTRGAYVHRGPTLTHQTALK